MNIKKNVQYVNKSNNLIVRVLNIQDDIVTYENVISGKISRINVNMASDIFRDLSDHEYCYLKQPSGIIPSFTSFVLLIAILSWIIFAILNNC